MKRSQNISDLESLAISQWGMFTIAQAQGLGVRRNQVARMVDSGRAEMVCYGVYRFCVGAETEHVDIKAAWLSIFPKEKAYERLKARPYDAVVAGRTAAYLYGIGDFYASPYTFAVNRRKQTSREDMLYLLREVEEKDVTIIDSLPVTSFERTVYDLIKSHEDPDLIDKFIEDASRKANHVFDRERLAELLAPLSARNGFGKMDGKAFATDLLSRNSAGIQLSKASKSMVDALDTIYSQEDMKLLREQMRGVSAALAESDAVKRYSEIVKAIQDSFASNEAFQELQNTLKGLSIPNANIPPGLESLSRRLAEFNVLNNNGLSDLSGIVSLTDLAEQQRERECDGGEQGGADNE